MDTKARIQEYLDYKGVKTATFEKEVGLSNGYWRKTKSISANAVADILRIYSDLSAEWVFRGEGNMLRDKKAALNGALDDAISGAITDLNVIKQIVNEQVEQAFKKYKEA